MLYFFIFFIFEYASKVFPCPDLHNTSRCGIDRFHPNTRALGIGFFSSALFFSWFFVICELNIKLRKNLAHRQFVVFVVT